MFGLPVNMLLDETFVGSFQSATGVFLTGSSFCRVDSALTGNQMQECRSFWSCLIRPSLKVFKFPRIDMAQYSEVVKGTSLKVFGFCMQQRAASRTVQDVQPFGGLVSIAETFV